MTPAEQLAEMHWATAEVDCPRCGSGVGELCINPITGLPSKLPCLGRVRAVDAGPVAYGSAA